MSITPENTEYKYTKYFSIFQVLGIKYITGIYFLRMFSGRQELMDRFKNQDFIQHPDHIKGIRTLAFLQGRNGLPVLELPAMRVEILGIDYLEYSGDAGGLRDPLLLHFQQNCFRLWFQVDGNGILQNLSQNIYGAARPGLLGIMERSRRYSYLHQKGPFECFQFLFSLLPSPNAKCYWNSDIEGKCVLEGETLRSFERLVGDLLLLLADGRTSHELSVAARMFDILAVLFAQKILSVEESQFPKNKAKSLVKKAMAYMELHYARMRHQKELEQECGVDINYLNIIFKRETGGTLYEYLTRLRMEQAKHLLATTSDPVTDIAGRTGYPNNNSFSRAFKRCEACTPLGFRSKSPYFFLKRQNAHSSTETP
jgi:AraC-like DNA-binding protein